MQNNLTKIFAREDNIWPERATLQLLQLLWNDLLKSFLLSWDFLLINYQPIKSHLAFLCCISTWPPQPLFHNPSLFLGIHLPEIYSIQSSPSFPLSITFVLHTHAIVYMLTLWLAITI